MTNGQIAQLQELSRCYMPRRDRRVLMGWKMYADQGLGYFWSNRMFKSDLRRLWHQYRGQIAAMRKNRK